MASPRPAEHPDWIRPQGDCRNTEALDKGLIKKGISGTISSQQFWVIL